MSPDGVRADPTCSSVLDWLFRNRRTGQITVAQFPNVPILVWLGASLLSVWWSPRVGDVDVLAMVSRIALVVWAGDEVARGVNPFRRILGAVVLLGTAWSLLQ